MDLDEFVGEVMTVDMHNHVFWVRFLPSGASERTQQHIFPLDFVPPEHRSDLLVGELFVCQMQRLEPSRRASTRFTISFGQRLGAEDHPSADDEVHAPLPPLTVEEIAEAVNSGAIRDEIDAATGWDPELAI